MNFGGRLRAAWMDCTLAVLTVEAAAARYRQRPSAEAGELVQYALAKLAEASERLSALKEWKDIAATNAADGQNRMPHLSGGKVDDDDDC